MPLHFFKPVVWNDQGYQRPGGAKFTTGYPKEHGFGHEEWNNADGLAYEENGHRFRVFHTEGFGNQPLSDYDGDIFVLMTGSHQGKQYLVAIGAAATNLFDKEGERRRLANKLRVSEFWQDLWALNSVRRKYRDDQKRLRKFWTNKGSTWFAVWKCPADLYLALNNQSCWTHDINRAQTPYHNVWLISADRSRHSSTNLRPDTRIRGAGGCSPQGPVWRQ